MYITLSEYMEFTRVIVPFFLTHYQVRKSERIIKSVFTLTQHQAQKQLTLNTPTADQLTYRQAGSPEYDYARPEGSTSTDYEAVSKPQSSFERP